MSLEKSAQLELGILQRALKNEGAARALEQWVTSGDEAAKVTVFATAPIAASQAGTEWGRLIFLEYDDLAVADRQFDVVARGFGAPSAWLPWAMASVRLSERYAAATRHLQRRLGSEVRTPEVPRSTLMEKPAVRLYFPLLEAFLDAVARAEPALLDQARAGVIRSFAGPRVAEELPEYLSTLAGVSPVREVSVPAERGTDWCRTRHVGPVCVVLRERLLENGISHSRTLEVTLERNEDAARVKAEAAGLTASPQLPATAAPPVPATVSPRLLVVSTAHAELVTGLPGTGDWVASGLGAIVRGGILGQPVISLAPASDAPAAQLTGLCGIGRDLALVSFPTRTAVLRFEPDGLSVVPMATLGDVAGRRSALTGNDTIGILACGHRLSLLAQQPHTITEGVSETEHFTAVAIAPGSTAIAVGRGDGAIELRDPLDLTVRSRIPPDGSGTPLALRFVGAKILAVATDDGQMRFLDLKTKRYSPAVRSAGAVEGGPVIQFVSLSERDYAAVGRSRHVSVFRSTAEVRAAYLGAMMDGESIVGASSVMSDQGMFLLLACGAAGLRAMNVAAIPVVPKPKRAPKPAKAVEENQLDQAVALVRAYLDAELAAQKATLLEASDDRYRELEAHARSFLHVTPDNVHGLPFGRAAVPGGTMLVKEAYRTNETLVKPQLFSVVQHLVGGEPMFLAHIGSAFGRGVYGDRLHIARVGAELKIVGRSGCDPFRKRLSWEAAGGRQPGRLAKPAAVQMLEPPTNPVHLAHHVALRGNVPARGAPALPSPEAAAVLADYVRLQEGKEWKDANAAIGVFGPDERPAIVVADPAGLQAARPLERAAPRDMYHVFWLPGSNGRARALLLRRAKTRKRAAATAEAGGDVRIDTAAIAVVSEATAQRLRTSTNGDRLVARLSEAPMGAFELETQHGVATGFATLVAGDGVARATWLLDERGEVVALHILPPGAA